MVGYCEEDVMMGILMPIRSTKPLYIYNHPAGLVEPSHIQVLLYCSTMRPRLRRVVLHFFAALRTSRSIMFRRVKEMVGDGALPNRGVETRDPVQLIHGKHMDV